MNESLPLVSFIAACYNHAGYVIETLESIIQQDIKIPFEVIITDDFSKDNSVDVISRWVAENGHRARITTLFNEQNLGLCTTLNRAVSLAKGQWIKPISCDDILEKNYLKNVWEYVRNHATISLVCTDMSHIDSEGKKKIDSNWQYGRSEVTEEGINDFNNLLNAQYLNAPTLFYKKELWEKIGGYDEELVYEDWDFLLRLKKISKFGFIKESLVRYRMHEANMHKKFDTNTRYVKDTIKVLTKHLDNNPILIREKVSDLIFDILLMNEEEGIRVWEQEINWIRLPEDDSLPLISVLMTAYNSEKYIESAIRSILLQSYTKIEFVIVNDGSTDNTLDIVRNYSIKYPNIKLINQENKGIAAAANVGLKECSGKYIARMDSDDLCHPNRIEKEVDFLEKNAQFSAVSSWLTRFFMETNTFKTLKFAQDSAELKAIMPFDNPIPHAPALIQADILKRIGYDEKFNIAEDYNMWYHIFKEGGCVKILPKSYYIYRFHNSNITNRVFDDTIIVQTRLLQEINLNPTEAEIKTHKLFAVPSSIEISISNFFFLHEWFKKVLKANQEVGFYPIKEFEKQLDKRWKHWYYQNKQYHGIRTLFKLLFSPFHKYNRLLLLKESVKGFLKINQSY